MHGSSSTLDAVATTVSRVGSRSTLFPSTEPWMDKEDALVAPLAICPALPLPLFLPVSLTFYRNRDQTLAELHRRIATVLDLPVSS